jgi:hypothetical protein
MKIDEQDDLWRLLGHAKAPSVSPFFSRNVLRAIRDEKQEKTGHFGRVWARLFGGSGQSPALYWRWALLSASASILLAVSAFSLHHASQPAKQQAQADQVIVLAQQVSTSPDYQVINHLDELLASEETSVWLEK